MEELSYDDLVSAKTEDVGIYAIANCNVYALAAAEYWEDHPECADNDPYRINEYRTDIRGQEWILDKEEILEKGLIQAIVTKAGYQCGGIWFCHEEDRGKLNTFEELYDMYKEYNPKLLRARKDDMQEFLMLSDGFYIVMEE